MKRSLLMSLAVAMVAALAGSPAGADDATCAPAEHPGGEWRFYGHDLSNTRHQDQETVLTPGKAATLAPAWQVNSADLVADTGTEGGDITGTPIVADGCVYIATNRGWMFVLNADTGELVWRQRIVDRDGATTAVNASVAVVDGVIYVPVDRAAQDLEQEPFVLALDQATGAELYRTVVDEEQIGSNFFGSIVVWNDMVLVGISGLAEVEEDDIRDAFQGAYAILEAWDPDDETPGEMIHKGWVNPPELWEDGYSGGTIWSTPSVDPETGLSYWGTGNPFDEEAEHNNTNAVIQVDLNPGEDFGEITGTYKGQVEQYFPFLEDGPPCVDLPDFVGGFIEATQCAEFDLDIGASPNIFTDADGNKLVGVGQKSGVYHAFDPITMEREWTSLIGVPSEVGGIVGSTAWDGEKIYGPHTVGGYLWSINDTNGDLSWVQPLADAVHWGNPVNVANGVTYTSDFKGFLVAYDSATGLPLLHRPMWTDVEHFGDVATTWGGTSIARNTVYASIGIDAEGYGIPQLPNGYVIAYRPDPAQAALADAIDEALEAGSPLVDELTPELPIPEVPEFPEE